MASLFASSAMSQPSLASFVLKRPYLSSWMKPLANWYANAAGYRKLGLRYVLLVRQLFDDFIARLSTVADMFI